MVYTSKPTSIKQEHEINGQKSGKNRVNHKWARTSPNHDEDLTLTRKSKDIDELSRNIGKK
ncbi:MAG TPA: hypothetical protein VKM55_09615 [Candidatus Lokiarchaeia archaeon]|nr:hypothetical protein [Candidatus Lokiarchaeia archaeon]